MFRETATISFAIISIHCKFAEKREIPLGYAQLAMFVLNNLLLNYAGGLNLRKKTT